MQARSISCSAHLRAAHAGRARTYAGLMLAVLLVCGLLAARALHGQTQSPQPSAAPAAGAHANRELLTSLAEDAERRLAEGGLRDAERKEYEAAAAALRERLREGDFRAGDRIVLEVRGDSALTDTFVVRAGPALQLPNLPDIHLRGVLRAELRDHLATEIARYVRDPVIRVGSLIRLAVLGEVNRPGYYALPADMLLSDAIMAAGGPTSRADLERTTIERGSTRLLAQGAVRTALTTGSTLDQLSLRAGDEVVVGEERRTNWEAIARTASIVLGLGLAIYGATSF